MLNNYIVPYTQRFCDIDTLGNCITYVSVNGRGVAVRHSGDAPSEDSVRGHLIGSKRKTIMIQAADIPDCLNRFNNLDGRKFKATHRALELTATERDPIIEYTGCAHMDDSTNCHFFDEDGQEFESSLSCILSGCTDVHDECPIKQQQNGGQVVIKDSGVWVRRSFAIVNDGNWSLVEEKDFFELFNAERDQLEVSLVDKEWIDYRDTIWNIKETGKPRFRTVKQMRLDEGDDESWDSRFYTYNA